jgi:putative aminopeptidase FrvX
MDDLLRTLIEVPGIPGYEHLVRELIAARLPAGVATETDAMGNLVVRIGGDEPPTMFVAHMDEIGFVVSEVRDDGFLKLKPLGGIDARTVFGRALRIVTERDEIPGVAGVKPPHLMQDRASEMGEVPPVTDLLIDIGARSGEEAAELGVKVLDFAVLFKELRVLNEKLLCARALDDRLGCYILLRAMERLLDGSSVPPACFAFSVQEEVGLRGATLLARRHALEYAFAVDSVSAADWPGAPRELGPAALGAGACLRVLDNASIIPTAFRREIAALAEEEEIPLQIVFSGGGTDAKPFQTEGPQVMSISFPVRYTHSAVEMAHVDDVEQTIRLVCALARRYASGGDRST